MFDDSIRKLLGFHETMLYKEDNLSPNPVDILSVDNIFLECDIAKGMIFLKKQSRNIHNWTMAVDPGYKYTEKKLGSYHLVYDTIRRFFFKYFFRIKK